LDGGGCGIGREGGRNPPAQGKKETQDIYTWLLFASMKSGSNVQNKDGRDLGRKRKRNNGVAKLLQIN